MLELDVVRELAREFMCAEDVDLFMEKLTSSESKHRNHAGRGDLTPRQREAWEKMRAYVDEHGYSPTVREVTAMLGNTSTNGTAQMLDALQKKGWLLRVKGTSREMTVYA